MDHILPPENMPICTVCRQTKCKCKDTDEHAIRRKEVENFYLKGRNARTPISSSIPINERSAEEQQEIADRVDAFLKKSAEQNRRMQAQLAALTPADETGPNFQQMFDPNYKMQQGASGDTLALLGGLGAIGTLPVMWFFGPDFETMGLCVTGVLMAVFCGRTSPRR